MSSPQGFRESSPAGAPGRRRSQFTYRHLSQLASYSTTNPLRVVAHIDLDAFYAQCEMVRLGVAEDQPLAVQQWYVRYFVPLSFRLSHDYTDGLTHTLSLSVLQARSNCCELSGTCIGYRPSLHRD